MRLGEHAVPVWFIAVVLVSTIGVTIHNTKNPSASDGMRVYVEPETSVVVVYAPFKVNVSVADVPLPGVWGYEFELHYDNALLHATKAEVPPDHWLRPSLDSSNIFVVDPGTINQTQGYVSFAVTLLAAEPDKIGNETLVTVTFGPEETFSSNITISHIILTRSGCGPWMSNEFNVYEGFVEVILPDFDQDITVDIPDLVILSQAFGSGPSHKRWNPICDVNRDSRINIVDVAITAKAYCKTI